MALARTKKLTKAPFLLSFVVAMLLVSFYLSSTVQTYSVASSDAGVSGSQFDSTGIVTLQGSRGGTMSAPLNQSALIWFFGYLGTKYYPQTELNINQSQMLAVAKQLSVTFGKPYLKLFTAVDEVPVKDGTITPEAEQQIKNYVSELKTYASGVYGRLQFDQFNLSPSKNYGNCVVWSACPIYNQSALLINKLGLNGIWFDGDIQYWAKIGNVEFNKMMQNLTKLFPKATFLLNVTPSPKKYGYITELPGYTWEKNTYLAASPPEKSLFPSLSLLQQFNTNFPGHVILHFDAAGPPGYISLWTEPMSLFANDTKSQEESVLVALLHEGVHPDLPDESYSMVIPVVGAWTYPGTVPPTCHVCMNYHGTLYNSLSIGRYARSTMENFTQEVCTIVVSQEHICG